MTRGGFGHQPGDVIPRVTARREEKQRHDDGARAGRTRSERSHNDWGRRTKRRASRDGKRLRVARGVDDRR